MRTWFVTVVGALIMLLAPARLAIGGEMHEWTGARGLNVVGEFVEIKNNQVVVKNEEGKLVEIPLMQLGAQDQMYARRLAMQPKVTRPGASGQTTLGDAPLLPAFHEGKWAGQHAVYEGPKMDITINTKGASTIYPKDDGKRVGPPIHTDWLVQYHTEKDSLDHYRLIEYFINPLPPGMIKDRFRTQCKLEEKDKVELDLQFRDNALEVTAEFKEPSSVKYRGTFIFVISIPPTHKFADGTPLDKITKELTGYSLHFKEENHHEVTYDYGPHVTLTNSIVSAEIKGPWGPRVLKIEQPRQDALYIRNYVLTPLYSGYSIYKFLAPGAKSPPLRITVE